METTRLEQKKQDRIWQIHNGPLLQAAWVPYEAYDRLLNRDVGLVRAETHFLGVENSFDFRLASL